MTKANNILGVEFLGHLPAGLRNELLKSYAEILRNYRERRWEPSELNGGKLCEVIYSILNGYVIGKFPQKPNKPRNMADACRALENTVVTFPRSVRIQIPRMLVALYEIRNNRGVGHVGGDVDPNHMDATCVVEMSKWLLSELVRVFHNVTIEEASAAVEILIERIIPIVWKTGDNYRVLDPKMSMKDKTLLFLYHSQEPVSENYLFQWTEHTNISIYRRDILRATHKRKLLEYDGQNKMAEISPLGIGYVEDVVLKSYRES
jgi:hypothetical protein